MPKLSNLYGKIIFNRGREAFAAEHFSSLGRAELETIYAWRTNPETQRWMYTGGFTLSQHLEFAAKLKERSDAYYWLLRSGAGPAGVFYITGIRGGTGELGLYSAPGARRAGDSLIAGIFHVGFGLLKLRALRAEVFEDNLPACRLYERSGLGLISTAKRPGSGPAESAVRTYSVRAEQIGGEIT